jgi:hypothetical protein
MGKSAFAWFGLSFAAGIILVIVFMPQYTGQPRFAMATNARLTMQKAISYLSGTFPMGRSTTTIQGARSYGERQSGFRVVYPPEATSSAEPLSFNRTGNETVKSPGLVSPAPALTQKLRNNLPQ